MHRLIFAFALCFSLFVSASAQNGAEQVPSLQDAETRDDVYGYLVRELNKVAFLEEDQRGGALTEIFFAASDQLRQIAKNDGERQEAYHLKIQGFLVQVNADVDGAEQKLEDYINELDAQGHKEAAEKGRFQQFMEKAWKTEKSPESSAVFLTELKMWVDRKIPISEIVRSGNAFAQSREISVEQLLTELLEYVRSEECALPPTEKSRATVELKHHLEQGRFSRFYQKAMTTEASPENFEAFKSELKTWIDQRYSTSSIGHLASTVAQRHGGSAEQIVRELVEYIQSESPLSASERGQAVARLEAILRLTLGNDPKLYGKMLDDEDFDWESLRGKYVLLKFTATWCGPCKMEIPGMLEVYQKYHQKGLEIVSIYVWEHGSDPVETVKKSVASEKLPWIILSEALTEKAGQPGQGTFYVSFGVPTMVLVDQEGKIILAEARGETLKTKLAEIFE